MILPIKVARGLFQALGSWERKRASDRKNEEGLPRFFLARFRSSPATESLEQAKSRVFIDNVNLKKLLWKIAARFILFRCIFLICRPLVCFIHYSFCIHLNCQNFTDGNVKASFE